MISAEQIAAIDHTIAAIHYAYPDSRFLSEDLDTIEIEDKFGDYHVFDVDTQEEMTQRCEECDSYRTDDEFEANYDIITLCRYCRDQNKYVNQEDPC
mgnify:CR=1 FL=1